MIQPPDIPLVAIVAYGDKVNKLDLGSLPFREYVGTIANLLAVRYVNENTSVTPKERMMKL